MHYGSFREVCQICNAPVCGIFIRRPPPRCEASGPTLADGSVVFTNPGDFVVSLVCLVVVTYLCCRVKGRLTGVGRKEFSYLYLLYACVLVAQILTVGWTFPNISPWIACIYVALVAATFWCLLYNGFTGYQLIPDGGWISLTILLATAAVLFGIALYVALDTRLGLTPALIPLDGIGGLDSPAIFTLYVTLPLVSIGTYLALQTFLVVRFLAIRRPLLYLYGAVLVFAVGQVFLYAGSVPLCESSNGSTDGLLLATLLTTISLCLLYIYWVTLTAADDPEVYEADAVKS